jgi:cytochrome c oxidase assembly protein subunit 15
MKKPRFSGLQLNFELLVFYTLLVILWGAWVRISHSGDGCGDSWPLCNDQLIPQTNSAKTWTEFSHRFMSGLYGIWVLGIWLWVKFKVDPQSSLQKTKNLLLFFTFTEAALGAKLVLSGLVGLEDSIHRSFFMSLHMINSLALMAATYLCSLICKIEIQDKELYKTHLSHFLSQTHRKKFILAGVFLVFVFASGAIASLSTTIFPSSSLWEGLLMDFKANSHYLVKLRGSHPLTGLIAGLTSVALAYSLLMSGLHDQLRQQTSRFFVFSILQTALGILALLMLSPLPLKILHLTVGHLYFLSIVGLVFWSFFSPVKTPPTHKKIFFAALLPSVIRFFFKKNV